MSLAFPNGGPRDCARVISVFPGDHCAPITWTTDYRGTIRRTLALELWLLTPHWVTTKLQKGKRAFQGKALSLVFSVATDVWMIPRDESG